MSLVGQVEFRGNDRFEALIRAEFHVSAQVAGLISARPCLYGRGRGAHAASRFEVDGHREVGVGPGVIVMWVMSVSGAS